MTRPVAQRSILVAEDNAISRDLLMHQLRLLGHEAVAAEDGTQALAAWRAGEFAMLLTDVQMPGLDGYALAATIRAEESLRSMPILVLTASGLGSGAEHGARACVDEVLSKPVSLAKLRSALDRWLAPLEAPRPTTDAPASVQS